MQEYRARRAIMVIAAMQFRPAQMDCCNPHGVGHQSDIRYQRVWALTNQRPEISNPLGWRNIDGRRFHHVDDRAIYLPAYHHR
jgi:hypothetical protein